MIHVASQPPAARAKGGRPKRNDVDAAVRRYPDLSAREIAELVGCSHQTVLRRREVLDQRGPHGTEFWTSNAPRRPVLRYHGGKWMLGAWIVKHLPPHRVYVEPYGGAGSVLIRKERAEFTEVYNDLDGEVVNLFRVLREPLLAARLRDLLEHTRYSQAEFRRSYIPARGKPLEQARRTVVRAFLGFGSDSASGAKTGFRANGNRNNSHPATDFANYAAALEGFTARLQKVVISCRPALEVILQHDAPRTLHYADPPYVPASRSAHVYRTSKGYRFEMSVEEHEEMATVLHSLRGMVVLSGYPSDLYDRELFPDWHRVTRATHADGGLDRTEVLWLNPAAWAACPLNPDNQHAGADLFTAEVAP